MKKSYILVSYYNLKNFGDDLFVSILCEQIKDYKVYIIGDNFWGLPKDMSSNAHYLFSNYLWQILFYFNEKVLKNKAGNKLNKMYEHRNKRIEKKAIAYVRIGGSLFIDKPNRNGSQEIVFSADSINRNFEIVNEPQKFGNRFLIGVNFGPVFHENYWSSLKEELKAYNYITTRDYSSFVALRTLNNIQYAPDIGFLSTKITNDIDEKLLVISVVSIEKHTSNRLIIDKYYKLLAEASEYWIQHGGSVSLLSFCEREGDVIASKKVLSLISEKYKSRVDVVKYRRRLSDIQKIIASASYVISSRFHCMIIGFVNDKKIFPISYNCKTKNYLMDIPFSGAYATLDDLINIDVDCIFDNYRNDYVCDSEQHKKYAKNHFYGLKKYLDEYRESM